MTRVLTSHSILSLREYQWSVTWAQTLAQERLIGQSTAWSMQVPRRISEHLVALFASSERILLETRPRTLHTCWIGTFSTSHQMVTSTPQLATQSMSQDSTPPTWLKMEALEPTKTSLRREARWSMTWSIAHMDSIPTQLIRNSGARSTFHSGSTHQMRTHLPTLVLSSSSLSELKRPVSFSSRAIPQTQAFVSVFITPWMSRV